jgi:hypothetical protein
LIAKTQVGSFFSDVQDLLPCVDDGF